MFNVCVVKYEGPQYSPKHKFSAMKTLQIFSDAKEYEKEGSVTITCSGISTSWTVV